LTTEEVKKAKNPDYSESAVKLVNPPEVKGLFDEWLAAKQLADEAQATLEKEIEALPSAVTKNVTLSTAITARATLEQAIVEFGGYQDVEQGLYALQQIRKLTTYDPVKIRKHIPDFADKILVQVDASRLKGLLKGGLVTQEQMDKCSEVKESKRFVIEARE